MPVGICAGELRGNFCAENRSCHDTECQSQYGEVETAEMEDFGDVGVFQNLYKIWCRLLPLGNLDNIGSAISR